MAFADENRLPDATPAHPDIIINELQYNPGGGYDVEFVELYNPNDFAVDLSGWAVEGIDLTFQHGTVINADSFLIATKNDPDFKAEHAGNIFVADQYNGKLSNGGELIELLDSTGYVIDEVEYSDGNEDGISWPSEADGSGYSLSLRATNLDNSLADSWIVSAEIGGTPGRANDILVPQLPSLEVSPLSFNEGDAGVTEGVLQISLSSSYDEDLNYSWELVTGTATVGAIASDDTDVVSNSGIVTFTAGSTSAQINIQVIGDESVEQNETFAIEFNSAESVILTVLDDDDDVVVESGDLALTVQNTIISLPITSFSNQDRGPGQISVDESGFALSLSGNLWKRALFDYTITSNTILEFDFQGTQEGEVHSIGFETNNSGSSSLVFQVWGTERYGKQDFNNYASNEGAPAHYVIPVGEYLRSKLYNSMVFISNHDKGAQNADSVFSNIRVYEGAEANN